MIFQAVIAFILVVLVLVQFGKGAEAGLMGGVDSVFSGKQQGDLLTKLTIIISIIFFANSVYLARLEGQKSSASILDNEKPISRPLNSDSAKTSPIKANDSKTAPKSATPKK